MTEEIRCRKKSDRFPSAELVGCRYDTREESTMLLRPQQAWQDNEGTNECTSGTQAFGDFTTFCLTA